MNLTVFARFRARTGAADAVAAAIAEVLPQSRAEPGCLGIEAYRSIQDRGLFHIHSLWFDEAAFELHAGLPHTLRFLEKVQPLIDHPLDISRAQSLAG